MTTIVEKPARLEWEKTDDGLTFTVCLTIEKHQVVFIWVGRGWDNFVSERNDRFLDQREDGVNLELFPNGGKADADGCFWRQVLLVPANLKNVQRIYIKERDIMQTYEPGVRKIMIRVESA